MTQVTQREKRVRLNVRLAAMLHRALRIRAAELGITLEEATIQAVEQFTANSKKRDEEKAA